MLVFVNLAKLVLVAALELPKVALAQADERAPATVALKQELIILFYILAYALLLELASKVETRRGTLRKGVVWRERNPEVEIAKPEEVRGLVEC